MAEQHYSRVTYDMPQEQLNYFDTRARSSHTTAASSVARASVTRRDAPIHQRSESQTSRKLQRHDDDDEPKLATPKGSLSDQYHQYFAGSQRDADAAHPPNVESAAASVRSQKLASQDQSAKAGNTAQKLVVLQVRQGVPPQDATAPVQNVAGTQRNRDPVARQREDAASTTSRIQNEAHSDVFYWSHNAPSESSRRSVTNEPREPTIPANSTTRENRRRETPNDDLPHTPQNDYSQPKGDRQAPLRKSSIPRGTPMSRDSPSFRSDSGASFNETEQPQRVQRAYIPRQAEAIPPVRQPAAQSAPQRQVQAQRTEQQQRKRSPSLTEEEDEEDKMREDEENCTFQPHTYDSTRQRGSHFHDSPYRGSQGTNAPRDSRGDYGQGTFEKLHSDAEAARRASNGRQMQKKADEAELEINEKYGPRSTAINPRRSAVERDATQEEVFARLYADAQRYNREKAELEHLLEQKRQEERGDGPFDWNKGRNKKADGADDAAADGDEKPAAQSRRSVSRQKPPKNNEVFERLARPNSVTLSFQKQKELEEQEKQQKEQHEIEKKNTEMEKIAAYTWEVPAKSFTFADLESQNAMYAS